MSTHGIVIRLTAIEFTTYQFVVLGALACTAHKHHTVMTQNNQNK